MSKAYSPGDSSTALPDDSKLVYFFETYCIEEVCEVINNYPEKKSICIDFKDVMRFSRGLENGIINDYERTMQALKTALEDVKILKGSAQDDIIQDIEIQICKLPAHYKKPIRNISKKDIVRLICVEGFVRHRIQTKPKMTKAAFQCLRCGHITYVEQNGIKFDEPFAGCEEETCGKKGPFKVDISKSEYADFQSIKLQEFPDAIKGTKPYDITVELKDSLTGILEAGDRVAITGRLEIRQISLKDGKSTLHDYILNAVSIEKLDNGFDDFALTEADIQEVLKLKEDPEIKDKICASIAPSIYGYTYPKKALALQLFTGVRKVLPDGTILRGTINIGLIGDPSTAKSQLVRYTVKLSSRGIFTSGRSASAAGLTAAIVNVNNEWTIEGGAAVMASGGILGLDEIGQADEKDKSALHEVMEQNTVSIAKAGITATLKADCSVLAAGNPINGYFDREGIKTLAEQIDIPPALWTRFDLIFTIFDTVNAVNDSKLAKRVLDNHAIGGMIQNKEHSAQSNFTEEDIQREAESIKPPISMELLQKYISYARKNINPVAPPEVRDKIREFYAGVRGLNGADKNKPVPVTIRSLEALQRLTEASARMRLSNIISMEDFEFARDIVIESLRNIGFDENGNLDACLLMGQASQSQQSKID